MAKYIYQHRRASKDVLSNKETLIPQEGELIVEFDHENNLHRLKIGDGINKYSELSYLMAGDEILTQALPDVIQVTLDANEWEDDGDHAGEDSLCTCYRQKITEERATTKSRLDLQPDVDMLAEFQKLGIVLVTKNINGEIFVYSIGNMPTKTYRMQATLIVTDISDQQDNVLGIPIGASASIEETNAKIAELEAQMASISNKLYEPIVIESFSVPKAGKGSVVTSTTLTWKTNTIPTTLTVNGESLDVNVKSKEVEGSFDMNNPGSWTLTVVDERGVTKTKTISIPFYDAVYFGSISADVTIMSDDGTINGDALSSLRSEFRGSRGGSFVTTHESQRGIFICPVSYGKPQFKIGATPLPYDWEKLNGETPLVFANTHGYTNQDGYNVWRSYRDIGAKNTNITVI